ncbi:MAG: hypothetical protein JEZ02_03960 [Desulfatibacillum sp.]|nr:hypothetical protein [Desulfatibacillum sp.]
MTNLKAILADPVIRSFISRIEDLYGRMDQVYTDISQAHGFHCQGCEDNCCKTWFFHHTFLEYLCIMEGCYLLEAKDYEDALQRARDVIIHVNTYHKTSEAFRTMCPLNDQGKCMIYQHRPTICRLHGIHYQFSMPNGAIHQGIGCQAFEDIAKANNVESVLDRTPFYQEMAGLEKELRQRSGFNQPIKMTVAEMLDKQNKET